MTEKPITLDSLKKLGKPVAVDFGTGHFLTNVVCEEFNTDVCEKCQLRFRCITSEYLVLGAEELSKAAVLPVLQTIESVVEHCIVLNKGGSITLSIEDQPKVKTAKKIKKAV
jgi:hypothetical protein